VSIRTIATLVVAIFLGFVAVLLVRTVLNSQRNTQVAGIAVPGQTVPVVVADGPIARGQAIEASNLKVVAFPAAAVPAGSFQNIAQITGGPPRLAMSGIVANEPVLADKVSGPGGKLNMSAEVAAGMRAVSIRSNDIAGVGGFVLPGDRVDVLLTRTLGGGEATVAGATTVTQVLAENVRVLGVDQSDNNESDKPVVTKAVTLEVTPEQAQSISLGGTVGTVSLALRHVADEQPLARQATTVADLGFGTHRAVVRHSGGASVRVIRGVESTMFSYSAEHGLVGVEKTEGAAPAAMAAHTP
jgi:pilus assembly protein CpaB